jgi:uncharacterized LabA/DUF88 family protein
MQKELTNYAFIDSQNLNLGVRHCGWVLDFKRFRVLLKEKYAVKVAYVFIGYLSSNQALYTFLQHCGYTLVFKEVVHQEGKPKGNVDAELVLQAMIDVDRYAQAVIVSGDGDFACLVRYLDDQSKLLRVLAPNRAKCSHLLHKAAGGRIAYIEDLRAKLEYRKGG